jgi:hypothetical protein
MKHQMNRSDIIIVISAVVLMSLFATYVLHENNAERVAKQQIEIQQQKELQQMRLQ